MYNRRKIITCAPLPPPHGGIANWYSILCSEAQRHGYTFLNVNISPKKTIGQRTILYRVFVQGFQMLKQRMQLKRIIKKNKDVRVAHITTSGQLALVRDLLFLRLFKRKGIASVYHIHFGRIPDIFKAKNYEYKLLAKAVSMASATIAIDPKTYETLKSFFGDDTIHYVPNPVKQIFVNNRSEQDNILFLGNVLASKGIEELLIAWEKLSDKYPDWTLTIAGFCEDEYASYLKGKYSMKGVDMCGFLPHDEAIEKLAESAFLVLPSYTEGFPNVVIEAMMCEKAVVATDVGAISDILSGGCGIVISPKSVEELITALEALICDKNMRGSMGNAGKTKALSNYASDIIFKKYEGIWHTFI